TCDESPRLSAWLRAAADFTASGESSNRLDPPFFMEPNLTVAPDGWTDDATVLKIGLDLEFSPPWQRRTSAGDPFVIVIEPTREQVRQAAEEWDAEIAPYPDDHAKCRDQESAAVPAASVTTPGSPVPIEAAAGYDPYPLTSATWSAAGVKRSSKLIVHPIW